MIKLISSLSFDTAHNKIKLIEFLKKMRNKKANVWAIIKAEEKIYAFEYKGLDRDWITELKDYCEEHNILLRLGSGLEDIADEDCVGKDMMRVLYVFLKPTEDYEHQKVYKEITGKDHIEGEAQDRGTIYGG